MMTVNVMLLGKLALNGHAQGHSKNGDGAFRLDVPAGSTVQDVMGSMGVPAAEVAITAINGRKCRAEAELKAGDRVVLMPLDVAPLWRYLGLLNMGTRSVFDF